MSVSLCMRSQHKWPAQIQYLHGDCKWCIHQTTPAHYVKGEAYAFSSTYYGPRHFIVRSRRIEHRKGAVVHGRSSEDSRKNHHNSQTNSTNCHLSHVSNDNQHYQI